MLAMRVEHTDFNGQATLTVSAAPEAVAELLALADELALRSTIEVEGTIHWMNDPSQNGPTIR